MGCGNNPNLGYLYGVPYLSLDIYSVKNAWRLPVAVALGIYPTDAISAVATTYTPRSCGLISSFCLFMRGHPALPLPTFCGVECGRPGVQATWALGVVYKISSLRSRGA